MTDFPPKRRILVLDPQYQGFPEFYETLGQVEEVRTFTDLASLLRDDEKEPSQCHLLDIKALRKAGAAELEKVHQLRRRRAIGLCTDMDLKDYLGDMKRHGLFQVAIKSGPQTIEEVTQFVYCLQNPMNGFGLSRYFYHTSELYAYNLRTIDERNQTVDRVINHFATTGYEIHELYNVRLILEEMLNNALFHAFRDAAGEEKYSIHTFEALEEHEQVRVEYGSSSVVAGFTVTDNSGTLPLRRIIAKLERQFVDDSLFDENGRGLYLSHMLSSALIFNLEEGKRTQVVALFDSTRRRTDMPKPFMINAVGSDQFGDCDLDPDFD